MNKRSIIINLLIVLPAICQAKLFLIDQAECVVCGPVANIPIVDTDLTWKRTLEGHFVPLQKLLQNDIVIQQVASEKMPLDPAAAEKYIEGIKKQAQLNDIQFEELFAQVGRTLAEGIEMLRDQYTIEFFMHYKFKSQLVPTDDEINAYFEAYPEFIEGWYEIQSAKVSYEPDNREQIKEKIQQSLEQKNLDEWVDWSPSAKIYTDEVTEDQKVLENMKVGEIQVLEFDGFFELVKLLDAQPLKLQSLQDRRLKIIETLNRKKLAEMLANYNQSVKEFVDIIPLNQEIRSELA